jgi:NAD(P)H dehydrogenase (quinone)
MRRMMARAESQTMRLLLVHCHPDPQSYGAALARTAAEALRAAGHELRWIDLYASGFDPVLSADEKRSYLPDTGRNVGAVAEHVAALRWAEGFVVVYPTWYYGPPAMLKGWFERVWLPGVAFTVAKARWRPVEGGLKQIRLFVGITTSGSPWWWLRWIGDPGRTLFMRALKPLYARGCRMRWLQLHDMNHSTAEQRARFLARVRRTLEATT